MATIQIREIPEEAYEVLRLRARSSGQSIQAYMRDEVVQLAFRTTKAEAVAQIEAVLAHRSTGSADAALTASVLDDLDADRR